MLKTYITTALIIGAAVVIFGYFDYSYKNRVLDEKIKNENQTKIELERKAADMKLEKELNRESLDQCLIEAKTDFDKNFAYECKVRNREEDCSLSVVLVDSLENTMKDLKNDCYKKYPQ